MKLSAFEKIIRKVVREEIDYALRREITILKEELTNNNQVISEVKNEPAPEEFRQKLREQFTPQAFSQDNTLNGLLNETAQSSHENIEPQHNPHDPVNQFINKDYSQLMKAIDGKKNFRP
tara:strand:+ start:153 stop:512 length:360 start_codon:yes stop_codon:yes gene_type:complete